MIERYHLRYFLAVIDQGNFSRAAAFCGVSQPTLSIGISRLEAELGQKLFLRSSRRVELTSAGIRLADRARRIEQEFSITETGRENEEKRPTIRIGVLETLPSAWIERSVMAARSEAPDERIEIVFGKERRLLTHLDRRRLDAALTIVPAGRAGYATRLYREGYGLAMPLTHTLADRRTIEPQEVAGDPMIVRRHCEYLDETSRYFTASGVRPFISGRTESDSQALALVQGDIGLTVFPASYCNQKIAMAGLPGFDLTRVIGIVLGQGSPERSTEKVLATIGRVTRASAEHAQRTCRCDLFELAEIASG